MEKDVFRDDNTTWILWKCSVFDSQWWLGNRFSKGSFGIIPITVLNLYDLWTNMTCHMSPTSSLTSSITRYGALSGVASILSIFLYSYTYHTCNQFNRYLRNGVYIHVEFWKSSTHGKELSCQVKNSNRRNNHEKKVSYFYVFIKKW